MKNLKLIKILALRIVHPKNAVRHYVPGGYQVDLVANEPMVKERATVGWDGNGKMYVAQMITYMQDIDANREDEPLSGRSRLDDTDGDGKMDKRMLFFENMVWKGTSTVGRLQKQLNKPISGMGRR